MPARWFAAALVAAVATLGGCGADDEDDGDPIVARIDDAIDAAEAHYGTPPDFYEVSATETVVGMIVSVDDGSGAEQSFWSPDDGFVTPVAVEPVDRPTFPPGAIDFRPDVVLDQVREELPGSEIIDFAVTGAGDGLVVYDARLRSEQGGVILVLLAGDGRILGAQAA